MLAWLNGGPADLEFLRKRKRKRDAQASSSAAGAQEFRQRLDATIYAHADARTGEAVYVGQTIQVLYQRPVFCVAIVNVNFSTTPRITFSTAVVTPASSSMVTAAGFLLHK